MAVVVRLLFAGTPDVAVTALQALLASQHEVVAVLTRPAAKAGRGRSLRPSPVAECASAAGIDVLTDIDAARAVLPEVQCCPVVAFGQLIPAALLATPRHGWVNVHFSLLPRWRGAAPVQWAIRAGDERTGVTIFRLDAGLDTGPILAAGEHPIAATDTSGTLLTALADLGAPLLVQTLDAIEAGSITPREQDNAGATLAPKLSTDDARIDWALPAAEVDRRIRSCTPAPGAWTMAAADRIRIGPVSLTDERLNPGVIAVAGTEVRVGTADRAVRLGLVQPAGRRMMPASDWWRGLRESVHFTS